ncbi:unnamed protein product, partial [Iphiclides podalirius]
MRPHTRNRRHLFSKSLGWRRGRNFFNKYFQPILVDIRDYYQDRPCGKLILVKHRLENIERARLMMAGRHNTELGVVRGSGRVAGCIERGFGFTPSGTVMRRFYSD